ncbi:hypothetical protein HYU15_00480 [Candidatus Woesearchaeota archaeon]|nr:hypothetical protein [Candidatus Woesearchaeota archaeon]
MKGRLIVADGLDGSGKGVIVDAMGEWAEAQGMKVLDLRDGGELPEPEDLESYGAILSAEPTFSFVGKAIRDELIRENNRKYSAWSLAHAFALDREILYKRVIIPAISSGKHVFQERGVITSFVYQPVQERIQVSELMQLPGNRLAMQYAPGLLIISRIKPETVMARLGVRSKKDTSIFDNISFQTKIAERYGSEWLRSLFEQRGSKVVYLDTDEPRTVSDTKKGAVELWQGFVGGK